MIEIGQEDLKEKFSNNNSNYQLVENIKREKFDKSGSHDIRKKIKAKKNFNPNNLKVKKSLILSSPIFSLKYSYSRPNILCACEENGILTLIDTGAGKKRNYSNNLSENNLNINSAYLPNNLSNNMHNTLSYHEIATLHSFQAHYNSIFDFEWCCSDNKILTASGDMSSLLINYEQGSNIFNELLLIGHSKSIKNVKQSFYDERIFASCGRDGIIFIWDTRLNNKRLCNKNCEVFEIPHIHPVGSFKSFARGNQQLKKKTTHALLSDDSNTFTGINFYSKELLLSIETNEDNIKFWDMRKMLTEELEYFMNIPDKPTQKLTKKQISKIEEKENFIANCNQFSHIYMRYMELQEASKLSSKHNTSKNLLFGNLPNHKDNNLLLQNKKLSHANNFNKQQKLDIFAGGLNFSKIKNNISSSVEKEVILSGNDNFNHLCEYEEEQELKRKIKEISKRKNVKGLTSICINRENRKMLVNSMSNVQYLYDCLYWDKQPPVELRGHKSSFCVKSTLSPTAEYALSGSSDANIYIWDVGGKNLQKNLNKNEDPVKLSGFHSMEVGAVDWGRNNQNFIASACDNGVILIWDDL